MVSTRIGAGVCRAHHLAGRNDESSERTVPSIDRQSRPDVMNLKRDLRCGRPAVMP